MSLESIRTVVKRRDRLDDEAVTELFQFFAEEVEAGEEPEEALAMYFGLEPDYIMDDELLGYLT